MLHSLAILVAMPSSYAWLAHLPVALVLAGMTLPHVRSLSFGCPHSHFRSLENHFLHHVSRLGGLLKSLAMEIVHNIQTFAACVLDKNSCMIEATHNNSNDTIPFK